MFAFDVYKYCCFCRGNSGGDGEGGAREGDEQMARKKKTYFLVRFSFLTCV